MSTAEQIARRKAEMEKRRIHNLKQDVKMARAFALGRWPEYIDEEQTPTDFAAIFCDEQKHYFKIEFPDIDRMIITPVQLGEPMHMLEIQYRIAWENDCVYWLGAFTIRKELFGKEEEARIFVGYAHK